MKCFKLYVLLTFCVMCTEASDNELKEQVQAIAEQVDSLRQLHSAEVTRLKMEIKDLKDKQIVVSSSNSERNDKIILDWTKSSMDELRQRMKELSATVTNSVLLKQLNTIQNELQQVLTETSDLGHTARTQETRLDKVNTEIGRIKYEQHQMKTMLADLRAHLGKLAKEVKNQDFVTYNMNNAVVDVQNKNSVMKPHAHKFRHDKMMHSQIYRLSKSQDQLDLYQQSLQTQLIDVQRRLENVEQPNWNLISAKVDFLEEDGKMLRAELRNSSQKISDFDKVHTSLLELREDLESIENKVDSTIPEFRKEISKLDVNFAQVNAQSSYLKEDQENLRQSVKAIAVSISNAIDKAANDRITIKQINDSVVDLEMRSKQHYYKLNDHILKSEANNDINTSTSIPLPELMGEVKELQPVQHEYEDLVNQLPKDCSEILSQAGTYLIHPGHTAIDAWCMNGTTLLQRRYNGSIDFNRKFIEYVNGFGDPTSEYWLGLESMHLLTADNCSSMRIDMTDIYGGDWYAEYEHFFVGDAGTGYVLHIDGFKGNASDAFNYQNHMEFSTIDRDRDVSNTHCAANYEGGWWFSHCQHVNINGKYTLGLTWFDSVRNEWIAVASSEMHIYRRPGCS